MNTKLLVNLAVLGVIAALLALAPVASPVVARSSAADNVPSGATIPYSGRLSDDLGQPVADGSYKFAFRLYRLASGGEVLWSEAHAGVMVIDGGFSVLLGSLNPLPQAALDGGVRWLEVGVVGPGESAFTTLSPRQALHATLAALSGMTAPTALSCAHDHTGETWITSEVGLQIISYDDDSVIGITESKWTNHNRGVIGWAKDDISPNYGVWGQSDSTLGTGVYGLTTATTGDTVAVMGKMASSGTNARAVVGWASKTTGVNYGMWGQSDSSTGTGVYGKATSSGCSGGLNGSCNGVYGIGSSGNGIYGRTDTGIGVYAYSTGSGDAVEIYSQSSGNLIDAYSDNGGVQNRKFLVTNAGDVYADGSWHSPAADLAEMLPAVAGLEPGDVLVIGEDGKLTRCSSAYQSSVVGVYSTQPGFLGGSADGADLTGKVPLAVIGVVPVKASAENGAIHPGDLLAASSTPGHTMKAGSNPAVGTVIGKALGTLDSATGVIQMLVMLQ